MSITKAELEITRSQWRGLTVVKLVEMLAEYDADVGSVALMDEGGGRLVVVAFARGEAAQILQDSVDKQIEAE